MFALRDLSSHVGTGEFDNNALLSLGRVGGILETVGLVCAKLASQLQGHGNDRLSKRACLEEEG